ncbi:MAG: uroporphyrinogen decarboxylase family protein [Eubacteriales bacterium]
MGKELIFKALAHEDMDTIPWVPFAGVHAGKLKGYTAEEILKDADKLFESLMEVKKMYEPDGMPVIFDLQVEAEILGCDLLWAEYNPPSVKSHPLAGNKTIPCSCMIPTANSGRIPMIVDVMKRMKASVGDDVALYGLICGPFTLASHLRGSEIFMDMIMDPKYVMDLVEFCTEICIKMTDYYIDAGMDVIAVVDPLVSQISPKHFEQIVSDSFKALFSYIRNKNVFSAFFVCGNATNQIKVMCDTMPDCIAVDENVNMMKAKEITDHYNITLSGNIPLTTTMLHGNQKDNMKYVIDLMDTLNHKNLIISPGCDMPYDVPIENTIAAVQAAKRPESARAMIQNYEGTGFSDIEVEIPDYAKREKVLVEIFTLDPDQCAACTYMVNLVSDAFKEIEHIAEFKVYKYTIKEDIARTAKMGLTNLPTMCVDGDIKWISIIPDKKEFVDTIKEYAEKKKQN